MRRSPLDFGLARIINEFELSTAFPKKVMQEAAGLPEDMRESDLRGRVDLRKEVVVTIDGETARDFDDAVAVERLSDGGYLLKVSIADVSHFVRPGSAIDREAWQRGTSTYFPDRCLPMLPERLSNDLCSLKPGCDRLTFTAEMDFDARGNRRGARFYRSVIRSAARMTYTDVRKILVDQDPETIRQYKPFVPCFQMMGELSDLLENMRRERGSVDFDLPEPLIEIDFEEGTIEKIVRAERNKAHRLIEEFMIAANEAVAEHLTGNSRPMLYRVHEEPSPERVSDFSLLLHNLGFSVAIGKRPRPGVLAKVVGIVRGSPVERLVNTVLLRTMNRAVYDTKNGGHYGLASICYTHFTSPIRRYPDLVVHRILGGMDLSPRDLRETARQSSETERKSMKAEWAARDLAAALFMEKHVGKQFSGVISGVTKFGFFVELTPFFVEGLVSLRNLRDDHYIFHEKTHQLVGRRTKRRYQIGSRVVVDVQSVNPLKRWIDLVPSEKSQ